MRISRSSTRACLALALVAALTGCSSTSAGTHPAASAPATGTEATSASPSTTTGTTLPTVAGRVDIASLKYPSANPIHWLQSCLSVIGSLEDLDAASGVTSLRQSPDLGDSEALICAFTTSDASEKLVFVFGADDSAPDGDFFVTGGNYSVAVHLASDEAGTLHQHTDQLKAFAKAALTRLTG